MALSKEDKEVILNYNGQKSYTEWVSYFSNKYTYQEIYNYIKRNPKAFLKGKKDDVEVQSRKQSERSRQYNIEQDYFKTWSSNMAYIFGFWCADGCIYNDRLFDITVHKKDKYILKKIADELKYEGPLYDYVDRQACRLNFSCKIIYNDLIELGGQEHKSLILQFPKIPKEYLPDFIRGYFDGDGSVYDVSGNRINTAFCCGSKDFLFSLWDILKKEAGIEGGSYDSSNKKIVFGKRDSIKLAQYVYNNSEFYLSRKKDKFLKFINL